MSRISKEVLAAAKNYLKSENAVATRLIKIDTYNDYPPFYQYTAAYEFDEEVDTGAINANGLSFNEAEAKAIALFETIVRYALFHIPKGIQVYKVETRNGTITQLVGHSDGLFSVESYGCAAGIDEVSTLNRALLEVIERDAFAIYYYNQLSPHQLHIKLSSDTDELLNLLGRYHFQVHLFDITLDISLPVCLCILEDTSGVQPYFTLGLKAQTDWTSAIKGAILESLQSLTALRDLAEHPDVSVNSPILQRVRYWLDKKPKLALKFFFQGKKMHHAPVSQSTIFNSLWKAGIKEIYFRNIYKENGVVVKQASIPELVRLPSDKKALPNVANSRLFSIPMKMDLLNVPHTRQELNSIPHPFP